MLRPAVWHFNNNYVDVQLYDQLQSYVELQRVELAQRGIAL